MKSSPLGKELIKAVKEALYSKERGKIVRPKNIPPGRKQFATDKC